MYITRKYIEGLLKKFYILNCKPATIPMSKNKKFQLYDGTQKIGATSYRSLVGSLIYLINIRPDIIFLVSLLFKFMSQPSKLYCAAAKRIFYYLQGTKKLGLTYKKENYNKFVRYSDNDWASFLGD